MRVPLLVLAALLLSPNAYAGGQAPRAGRDSLGPSSILPVDPKIKVGTLANGLRYYIRQNAKPEKRAELRLVVNAGSILEKESELGYAHFVEHMAFNGTRNFAKNDLVKYLQSVGVRFGADLNAYTSFDETVYILPVPTDTQRIVDQAFAILEDWAHGLVFDSSEVVLERGVVREEWRGSKGADERMLRQFLPIALHNSRYADRLPIGTEERIMAAEPSTLRSFYRTWYRPDLMAVVAVGDFDPAMIEAKIRRHFSTLRRPANAPRRDVFPVPGNAAPLVAIASDKEAIGTDVTVFFKLPREATTTVRDYRRDLVGRLYLQMLNSRLNEITQKPDAPFIGAGVSKGGFVGREIEPFILSAAVREDGIERGLEALLVEARRVDQFGFLQSELDRARANMLRSYEVAFAERDKTPSERFADEYVRNFLEGEVIPGIEVEFEVAKQVLPTITLADVNGLASRWITDDNRVVVVRAPIKDGVTLPTEAQIVAVFAKAATASVVAYTETVSGEDLVSTLAPAGRVTATRAIEPGIVEWKLSNGARVLVKPTDYKADEILFGAYSPGGTGLAADSNFMSATLATQIVSLSGLGEFNQIDLRKKLTGKAVRLSATMSEMTEGLNGSASPKDLEALLQLVYLHFTGARVDTTAFAAFQNNVAPFLANRGSSPEQVFSDTIMVTMSQGHFRTRPISAATFSEVKADRAIAFFRDRFADADDFTFVFVGNVDTTTLRPLAERYLASLPVSARVDRPRAVIPGPPAGEIRRTVRKGVEPKATTFLLFTAPCVYSPETRVTVRLLVDVLQLRLIETLREKLGGTYSPSVSGACAFQPRQNVGVTVRFESSPENVEPLASAVFALIDTLQTQGPSVEDVAKAREQVLRSREVDLKQNSYWLSGILQREQAGESIAELLQPYDDLVRKVTPADLKAAAARYLRAGNDARFVLLPESSTPTP